MHALEIPRPTLRSLFPGGVAYVDPDFPRDRRWAPVLEPELDVARGEDVELAGELTLIGEQPFPTGQEVHGRYATFWFTELELSGVSLLAHGATPVGAVRGSYCNPGPSGVSITAGEGLVHLPTEASVSVDILLDADHRPCGYIINGGVELSSWASRILPEETGRVSSQDLLAALGTVSSDDRPEVVRRTKGFLGRRKTQALGHVGELDMGRAWEFPVVDRAGASTAGQLRRLLTEGVFRVGPDLGVEVQGGDPAWVVEVIAVDGHLQLVVGDVLLPDAPL